MPASVKFHGVLRFGSPTHRHIVALLRPGDNAEMPTPGQKDIRLLNRFTIRPARESDAASMAALLNPIIEAGFYTSIAKPIELNEQIEFIRMQDIVPATEAGTGDISTFIALHARRRGIGSALMTCTLAQAAALRYRQIAARVRPINGEALAFYQAHGFHAMESAGANSTPIQMTRSIPQPSQPDR